MVYKSDKIPNVCSRLNKLGFMALQEPHGYDADYRTWTIIWMEAMNEHGRLG